MLKSPVAPARAPQPAREFLLVPAHKPSRAGAVKQATSGKSTPAQSMLPAAAAAADVSSFLRTSLSRLQCTIHVSRLLPSTTSAATCRCRCSKA
jgi:hypothetical protein